jgi:AraC-like DNA-binding protein
MVTLAQGPLPGLRLLSVLDNTRPWCSVKESVSIVRFRAGEASTWLRGRVVVQRPGTLSFTEPGDVYRDEAIRAAVTLDLLSVDPQLLQPAREALEAHRRPLVPRVQLDERRPEAKALLWLHRACFGGADAATVEAALDDAAAALAGLDAEPARPARYGGAVRRAQDFLRGHLASAVTMDAVAAHARLDKFRLSRVFREEIGVPPYEWLLQQRVLAARAMLAGGTPVGEVAAALGYCDQSQLHRQFVRIVGVTPGAWLRAHRRPSGSVAVGRRLPEATAD